MTARDEADSMATWCLRQVPLPSVLAGIAILALISVRPDAAGALHAVSVLVSVLLAFATLGLGGVIAFDALLFRLIASYEDVSGGCAAVDDLLARMRLKPLPASTRPLPARAAGTRRLVLYQRLSLAACLVAASLSRLA